MKSEIYPPIIMLTANHMSFVLRSLRKRKGWTQSDLAERLNVSQQTVSRMEVNADNISWVRLHDVLNTLEAKVLIATNEYIEATKPKTEW